ncbi:MAG: hypothetical protein KF802_14620 [Bdellovibrionaceae bacterium]|nr:hypothetical protein [Pseudobdellovibrionaceae bacterium]
MKSCEPLPALKALILEYQIRQWELAADIGVPDYVLSLIINGRKRLTEDLAKKLERRFKRDRKHFLPRSYKLES